MTERKESRIHNRLNIAVFALVIIGMAVAIFVPNITAAATLQQETDSLPIVLFWALPIIAIVAVVMYFSYRAVKPKKVVEE